MFCPRCMVDTRGRVVDTRPDERLHAVRRYRKCEECGEKFQTVEITRDLFDALTNGHYKEEEHNGV